MNLKGYHLIAWTLVATAAIAADRKTDETKPVARATHQSYEGPGVLVVLDNGAMVVNKSANFQAPDPDELFIVIGQRNSLGIIEASDKQFSIGDSRTAKSDGSSYTAFVRTDEQSAEGYALVDLTGDLRVDVYAHRSGEFTISVTIAGEDWSTFSHQWLQSKNPLDPPTADQGGVAWVSNCSVGCDNGSEASISCVNQTCYAYCKGIPAHQSPKVGCGMPE